MRGSSRWYWVTLFRNSSDWRTCWWARYPRFVAYNSSKIRLSFWLGFGNWRPLDWKDRNLDSAFAEAGKLDKKRNYRRECPKFVGISNLWIYSRYKFFPKRLFKLPLFNKYWRSFFATSYPQWFKKFLALSISDILNYMII